MVFLYIQNFLSYLFKLPIMSFPLSFQMVLSGKSMHSLGSTGLGSDDADSEFLGKVVLVYGCLSSGLI